MATENIASSSIRTNDIKLLDLKIQSEINEIDEKISKNNEIIQLFNRYTQITLGFDTKFNMPKYNYNIIHSNTERVLNELNNQKKTFQIKRVKIQMQYEDLLGKRALLLNTETLSESKRRKLNNLERLINKFETALSKLEILNNTEIELKTNLENQLSYLNSYYLNNTHNSLQGLAATAIPEDRIKKLSPKSRKILKTIKNNTMNVFVPNESLGSSPETSPETAAEYVKRTSYAITKKSARSRKQRHKK